MTESISNSRGPTKNGPVLVTGPPLRRENLNRAQRKRTIPWPILTPAGSAGIVSETPESSLPALLAAFGT